MESLPSSFDQTFENAKDRLHQIADSSTSSVVDICIQQIVEAGLQAVDALKSRLQVHELVDDIAQYIDDACESLKSISEVNTDLESDIADLMLAIGEVREANLKLDESELLEGVGALASRIEEVSIKITWRVVTTGQSCMTPVAAPEDQVVTLLRSSKSISQTIEDRLHSISDILKTMIFLLDDGTSAENDDTDLLVLLGDAVRSLREELLDLFEDFPAQGQNLVNLFAIFSDVVIVKGRMESRAEGTSQEETTSPPDDGNPSLHADGYVALLHSLGRIIEIIQLGMAKFLFGPSDLATSIRVSMGVHRGDQTNRSPEGPLEYAIDRSGELITAVSRARGANEDLSTAISLLRDALAQTPAHHPLWDAAAATLAYVLGVRYARLGDYSDLTKAIRICHPLVHSRHCDRYERLRRLRILSELLVHRYSFDANLSDLSEAIRYAREAVELGQPGDACPFLSLQRLSSALRERYTREGHSSDLSDAINCLREALTLIPSNDTARPTVLANLASALECFSKLREGDASHLSEAIECYQAACELLPHVDFRLPQTLHFLALALVRRHDRESNEACTREPSDLSEAIRYARKSVEASVLLPPASPIRADCLYALSWALCRSYDGGQDMSNLSEAIEYCQKVLDLVAPDHHLALSCRATLLVAWMHTSMPTLSTEEDMHATCQHVDEILISLMREAATMPSLGPRARLRSSLKWSQACLLLNRADSLDACQATLQDLDMTMALGHTLEDKHANFHNPSLEQCKTLGVLAASCALREGQTELAVELLEQGRNLLFDQIGRYRVVLEELQTVNPGLAERFSTSGRLLDASVMSHGDGMGLTREFEDSIERYRRISSEWNQVVEKIRAEKGFEDFLKPAKFARLQAAASKGPIILLIPDQYNGQTHAVIVQARTTPHHMKLPEANNKTLPKLVSKLLAGTSSDQQWEADKIVAHVLRRLWDIVVGPIADALENVLGVPLHSRIWWCPAGLLSALPFHAAGYYIPGNPNLNLPHKYVSSYTPTLQALLRAQRDRHVNGRQRMLIVAQPDAPGQPALPGARREAQRVEKLAKSKMDTTVLMSKNGTLPAVLSALKQHSWLHLTCHGLQHTADPFESCFVLHDGDLTLRAIMKADLPQAEFAFLAACHIATGDLDLLDEGLHLAAGLQFAGFKSVVGTFWEVADVDGPVIAEAFYKALEVQCPNGDMDPSGAAQALSEAVKHLRDTGVPINRWIRFIHIGI